MVERIKWVVNVGDYRRDTSHLSAAEHGAYLMLLMHYWTHGSLPTDDTHLHRIACVPKQHWPRIKQTVQAFFHDGWKHRRVERDLKALARQSDVRRDAARSRWSDEQQQRPVPVDKLRKSPESRSLSRLNTGSAPKSLKNRGSHHASALLTNRPIREERAGESVPNGQHRKEGLKSRGGFAPVGRARQAATQNRKRDAARVRWERELAPRLGHEGYALAIDALVAHPRVVDQITDAELRRAGQGVVAALQALMQISSGTLPRVG